MTITASVYEIALFIIAISFLILVIAVVPAVLQLKNTVRAIEELARESKKTVESLNFILKKVEEGSGDIREVIARLKDAGAKIADTVEKVLSAISGPIINLISLIFGLTAGFKHLSRKDEKEKDVKGGGEDEREQG
ncbi:MAG: DUF948 domain-containing protein [Deltaproteobacteria bacterium]